MNENEQEESGVHAEDESIAINRIEIQGSVGRDFHIGNIYQREATPAEIRQQDEREDLDRLRQRISSKLENLKKQLEIPFDKGRNPYRFGQALSLREAEILAGQEQVIRDVLGLLQTHHSVFLTGNGGCGKTSLLQAGLMPPLIKQGDLPVLISVRSDPLDLSSIKKLFLPEVKQTAYLSQVSLSTFLWHVTECLPPANHVYLLVDELEDFLTRDPAEKESFKQGWLETLTDSPRIHWLFSIHQGFFQLLDFFRLPEVNPFSELVTLSLLDGEAARQAILKPASLAGINVDEAVSTDIVDRLGGGNIIPAQLQTVCYLMAGGNGPLRSHWTMVEYESEGRADGILRQSLERLVSQFPRGDREIAWQVMAVLVEHKNEGLSFETLSDRLQPYRIGSETLHRLLRLLGEIHLIDVKDEQYYLSSESLRPRIQQWVHEQSALAQARHEAMNQLRQLRNSALRGLLGGAIGFVLLNWFIYKGPPLDLSYRIFTLTQLISIGGIAGFLLTLTVDLSGAAYHGTRTWLRYPAGMIGGMVAMGSSLLLYLNNNYALERLLAILPTAALEGALWGAVIGLGATFAFSGSRRAWLSVLVTALAAGLVLLGMELGAGNILANDLWKERPSSLAIFLAGALVPVFYMGAALLFRRPAPEESDER
jgi:hypothetical protein